MGESKRGFTAKPDGLRDSLADEVRDLAKVTNRLTPSLAG